MADALMAALQAKLVAYESAGMTDHVKAVKARIAALEKPAKATVQPAAAKAPARKTVKKAVKQIARKKR